MRFGQFGQLGQRLAASAVVAGAIGARGVAASNGTGPVRIQQTADRISVTIGGKPFTALVADKTARKLYLHPGADRVRSMWISRRRAVGG